VSTLSRHFRGTSHNGAEPVEKRTPPRNTTTNTASATGARLGPGSRKQKTPSQHLSASASTQNLQPTLDHPGTADGPTEQNDKKTLTETDDDLGKDTSNNMTTAITSFQVSPDLMDQPHFHNYGLHDDKFDPSAFNPNSYEFAHFPDPPPLAGNPLFDEKEEAFMSSFFDSVDQNTSFDNDFQDGLAQWSVPGLDLRKGFDDPSAYSQNSLSNGSAGGPNYTATPTPYGVHPYDYSQASFPRQAAQASLPATHPHAPQQFNPSMQPFMPLQNPPRDIARAILHRNVPSNQAQCDPLYPNYPSLNIPVASPSAGASAVQTPASTPKLRTYSFLKHEISSAESSPSTSGPQQPRISIPRPPPSSYAPSSASSLSPQPSGRPSRKKRRENLSEAQKRLNHITSEQKRRNLIQQGFNEIHNLVPALRGNRDRGDSKSTVLMKTVDHILSLREGNDRLRRILQQR